MVVSDQKRWRHEHVHNVCQHVACTSDLSNAAMSGTTRSNHAAIPTAVCLTPHTWDRQCMLLVRLKGQPHVRRNLQTLTDTDVDPAKLGNTIVSVSYAHFRQLALFVQVQNN